MKKILILVALFLVQMGFGQKLYKKDLLQIEKNIYTKAVNNFDLDVAKTAVYHILELEQNSTYIDSLAFIYFNQKKYLSCVNVANKILAKEEKLPILEIKAISLENLNAPKEAIAAYEKLYAQKKKPYIAYTLAKLQYQIKRTAEAYQTLLSGEKLKFPEKATITFPTTKKGEVQYVPLKAAYYNLMAMVSYDLHSYDMALKYFDEALKVFPDFVVAKQNRQSVALMKEKLEQKDKTK